MTFKRAHHRAKFDSSLTTTAINTFIDSVYNLCESDRVSGLIIEIEGGGQFIFEGEATDVDNALDFLDQASELLDNDTYLTETSGTFFTCLASHVSGDARDSNC